MANAILKSSLKLTGEVRQDGGWGFMVNFTFKTKEPVAPADWMKLAHAAMHKAWPKMGQVRILREISPGEYKARFFFDRLRLRDDSCTVEEYVQAVIAA